MTATASVAGLIPAPEAIRASRKHAGLSQRESAVLIHVSRRSWQSYEEGKAEIKLGLWELYLFKTGQLWVKPIALKTEKTTTRRPGRAANLRPYVAASTQEQIQ
ncbi:helix-turn-helix domain-containing protein [Pseudomonas monteilii]|jgi:transcriptional regulator with XRE-family HTH domain